VEWELLSVHTRHHAFGQLEMADPFAQRSDHAQLLPEGGPAQRAEGVGGIIDCQSLGSNLFVDVYRCGSAFADAWRSRADDHDAYLGGGVGVDFITDLCWKA